MHTELDYDGHVSKREKLLWARLLGLSHIIASELRNCLSVDRWRYGRVSEGGNKRWIKSGGRQDYLDLTDILFRASSQCLMV